MWKIADFGLTVEGSLEPKKTKYRRGTACYRAPEILGSDPKFTQKVDLWALGCILYELVIKTKLFLSDYDIFQYANAQNRNIPIFPFSKTVNFFLWKMIRDLLQVDVNKRPLAVTVANTLSKFPVGLNNLPDRFDWVTGGDQELKQVRSLGAGKTGQVHEVRPPFALTDTV